MIPADLYAFSDCEYDGYYRCPECGGRLYPSHDGRALRCRADGCWDILVTNDPELRAKHGPQEQDND